jgi:hypothetical protein
MRAVGGHPILVDRHSFLPAQFAFTFHRRALLVPAWLMIAALATARTTHLWLFAALAAATALWLVVKAPEESVPEPPRSSGRRTAADFASRWIGKRKVRMQPMKLRKQWDEGSRNTIRAFRSRCMRRGECE